MSELICRAIVSDEKTVKFESASAPGNTLAEMIENDKKYGKMVPKNGKYFTYKAMDWQGKWITQKEITKGITLVWNMVEKIIDVEFREAKAGEYVDFKIYFRATKDDPELSEKTIMYHYYPINNFDNPHRGVCVVNTDFPFTSHGKGIPMHLYDPVHYPKPTTIMKKDFDFDAIYFHEGPGHGLGLPHSPNINTKMYYSELGMIESVFDETPLETIPRLQAKYPKKNIVISTLKRWISYFKVRQDKLG